MTTKDYQEAEREAFERFIIESRNLDLDDNEKSLIFRKNADGTYFGINIQFNWEAWNTRATITTPQVNEEPRLVSYAPDGSTCTLNINGEEIYFDRYHENTTPSPSNVLVEALLDIEPHVIGSENIKNIRKLIATYSASADSVTISKTEYEALQADAERYRKLKELALTPQTFKSFAISKFNGMHWDSYEGGIMDLDEAIDTSRNKP